jgi:hypothetical protein
MDSNRKIARIVGIIYIAELVVYMIGSTLTEGILDTPDYLIELAANKNRIILGVLLEAICAASLGAIGVMMYPILKRHSKMIARGYFGIRIVETVFTAVFLFLQLSVFALSQEYVKAGAPAASHFQTLGTLLKEGLASNYQIYFIFYSLGCLMLFGLLFRAKLVPRFISVLGLITAVFGLSGLVSDMFGSGLGLEIYGMPLALSQILLGIWLIIKGVNPSALASGSVNRYEQQ